MLTSFNGQEINYDSIGNPTQYYNGFTFTWTGRRLTVASKAGKTLSFTYTDNGIRTSKTVNGVTTTYYLSGSQIIAEETNGNITLYVYDANGLPIGFIRNNTNYWYEKNLQGDVVAVYSETGSFVASYTYDAYGNCISQSGTIYNPFRYRGYYYDEDSGIYYLQSRYYDSVTCRFISADGYVSTGTGLLGYNMYAYCNNNPVMGIDPTGKWTFSLGAGFMAVCLGGFSYSISMSFDDNGNFGIQISEANIFKKSSGAVIGLLNAGANAKFGFLYNSDTIYDLEEESFSVFGALGPWGAEVATSNLDDFSQGINSVSVTAGISFFPVDVSVTASKTSTIWSFNIVETAKKIWDGIVSWFK